ncbi:arylsulfatase B-like isoform X1 [Acanthaster planci]|uniref:Arylsulfatase B-like isoform X1 n=1 Tax=Acanthaster planci TaxID=133434 RepID=A0A8B7Z2V6_ACAPL|nr:arylsulfatase B-like isoform X1 [Acanthaster planci]XP_022099955.1 arylsulfatase B-like isoform X1 [Acanthaster planci]XP_022099956.1 arylsulfatase B-like isoform X1 [Acanthaster planci]XP_022099958.1 arylsulfatase B-like isoform X1 [Acanthaster planci]XP_022099959.1 arylsulfatase B-like isoform X1 [Acanthaster planci]XP_022099960.1 arylsulfatase B-like isoform X1 [Acanthaster planci]XP_022099961.1 arylsulfatase B-like isoform X1 [Acanthaster planci]
METRKEHAMQHFTTIFLLTSVVLALSTLGDCHWNSTNPPNIIFILADDYGFNDIGYHGSKIRTPWLDKLAAEGVKLENYYVQPICTPTRSQLMSGRYQIHTGLEHWIIWDVQPNCLPLDDVTLAEKLKELGYATYAVGKWHLGFYKKDCWPTRRGFDTFFGYYTGSEDYFTHRRGCGMPGFNCKGFTPGLDLRDQEQPTHNYNGSYSTHIFTEQAQQILENHNSAKPFFLYLPFQAVHSPLQVPEKYIDPYKHIADKHRRIYSGMVACMDEAIGNITQTLTHLGLWDNTVLIFSTDNGGQIYEGGNNWPLRGWKTSLWEGGVHGVGFVHSPLISKSVQGTSCKEMIHVSDWFPTLIAGVAGGHLDDLELDGFNVWQTISQGKSSPRKEILHNIDPIPYPSLPYMAEYEPQGGVFYPDAYFNTSNNLPGSYNTTIRAAIRVGDWKLLTGYPGNSSWIPPPDSGIVPIHPVEQKSKYVWLFNIREDPNEYHDLSDARPDKVKELVGRLQYYYSSLVPPFYPPGDVRANPALHGGIWTNWE